MQLPTTLPHFMEASPRLIASDRTGLNLLTKVLEPVRGTTSLQVLLEPSAATRSIVGGSSPNILACDGALLTTFPKVTGAKTRFLNRFTPVGTPVLTIQVLCISPIVHSLLAWRAIAVDVILDVVAPAFFPLLGTTILSMIGKTQLKVLDIDASLDQLRPEFVGTSPLFSESLFKPRYVNATAF